MGLDPTSEYLAAIDGTARHQRRLHGRPLGHPPGGDGGGRQPSGSDTRRGRPHGPPAARQLSRPAASASRRHGPAPTTTPTATWCRRATRHADEIIELCRVAGMHPAPSWSSSRWSGPFDPWAVELMADMSVAARRQLNWNVLTASAPRTLAQCRAKLAAGDFARDRGRQGGGPDRADELRPPAELRVRVRARRHAGLGGTHGALRDEEVGASGRPGRSRRP